MDMELDRISNLPDEIMEKILSCLPIKEAVRTNVLSSQWRYKAAKLKHLLFDWHCDHKAHKGTTFANIVDHVLLAHIGPIYTFKLFRDGLVAKDIDRWILHISRNSIKELILQHWGKRYTIPSCLFSCQDIVNLELCSCLLKKPPSTFKGFRSLRSLKLQSVTLAQDVFEKLIVCCPLLESLTMIYCDGFSHLMIDAPNLKYLDVRGSYKDVHLVNTSNLADVSIGLEAFEFYVAHQRQGSCNISNLDKFLSCLPMVQKLDIYCCSLAYLSIGALPGKLPRQCMYLNCLHITLSLTNLEESLSALCLFRSCPVLQELEVQVFPGHDVVGKGNSWLDYSRRCSFSKLRHVLINDFGDVKAELDFIRYLLLNSPVLKMMVVQPVPGVDVSKLKKKLFNSRRASRHLEMIFRDQSSGICV